MITGFGPLLGKILFKLSCNINEFELLESILLSIPQQQDFWTCLTELTPHTFIYENAKDPEKEINVSQHGIKLVGLILKCIKIKGDKEDNTQESYSIKRQFAEQILNRLHHNYLQTKRHGKARLSELLLDICLCLYDYHILQPKDLNLLSQIKSKRKQVLVSWQHRSLEFLNFPAILSTENHYLILGQIVNQDHHRIQTLRFIHPRRFLDLIQLIINEKDILVSKKNRTRYQQECHDILLKKIHLLFPSLALKLLVEKHILRAYNDSHIFYEKLHEFEELFFNQLNIAEQISFLS